ncbi:hypothetical protein GGI02_005885, partial [Coemansia sp. RSA 2322]
MSYTDRSRDNTHEQDVVAYAKRKREEEEHGLQTQAQLTGSTDALSGIQAIDLDLIEHVLDASQERALTDDALDKRRQAMAEFERKKLARSIATPTDDNLVKEALRKHKHPICLFGEDAGDRRNRLRYILSKLAMAEQSADSDIPHEDGASDAMDEDEKDNEEFFTEGSSELLQARQNIAAYSLAKARARIEQQREDYKADLANIRQRRLDLVKRLESFSAHGSQVGDTRPISRVLFSPNSRALLTASWSGAIKLWDAPSCRLVRTFCGHTDRVGGLSFHPQATVGLIGDGVADFASGAADNRIHL